jgi:hypothetical protein
MAAPSDSLIFEPIERLFVVIPAKAGIQLLKAPCIPRNGAWIPVCTGMTEVVCTRG